ARAPRFRPEPYQSSPNEYWTESAFMRILPGSSHMTCAPELPRRCGLADKQPRIQVISRPVFRPRFSWENLCAHDDLGRVEGVIDESAVRAHAYAIGDDAERYLKGFGAGPCVPPSLVVNDLLKMVLLGYDDSDGSYGGLHTK